ncbi:NaeI family type II restriction endonuclease [Agrococcus sp. Marseille-Q4369]|uniref:NaeI family type II restriction endonuclease n=1 Tax=Agrococcus sp. Marseille-Q4369 TaxID=2810513 RepID=UPI001B8D6609|nr:NaeI family type II restriction endonuclease [Agrococcus sp. Marseille-Q4369]QUW18227.1 restriction endonuclease [Agrococcus sp. Marseille-Q4369]
MLAIDGPDPQLDLVREALLRADPTAERWGRVFRRSFDQIYDGVHTGRYSIDQLSKTEKAHLGSVVEIAIRREFDDVIEDGDRLDYKIGGVDVDCKFSIAYSWMIPPEADGQILLIVTANDPDCEFAVGLIRASGSNLTSSVNRDRKRQISKFGRGAIDWLWHGELLPPNVLLELEDDERERIFAGRSGQQRVNELFRIAQGRRVSRNVVATVAQQHDYMKRVRANGGARTALAADGIAIFVGDYRPQRRAAEALGLPVPLAGEFVSARLTPAEPDDPNVVELGGSAWRQWTPGDGEPKPLPPTKGNRAIDRDAQGHWPTLLTAIDPVG